MVKVKVPNIVRGGKAIPIKGKTNYYYMSGRKHENGGIDIGKNPRTGLEVEDGEVMHITDNNIKVFSAQPFLNGESPAEKVMGGENPNKVFNAQEKYKDKNNINDDGTKNKKRMGGLSRSKDYGSKSKPYPKVKAGDFASDNRSYPIPTKADAVDALRLAGLHGRNDVKAKVYRKYPELRKKSKAGGLYSVTVNGKTKLKMFPSMGEETNTIMKYSGRKKAKNGTTYINGNNLLVPDIDIPEKIMIPKTVKTNTNNISSFIKNNPDEVDNYISLVSNIGSNLIGRAINNKALNKMSYSSSPMPKRAVKLKTNININPQLDKMRESLASYERNIDNNTSSSSVALSRKQRARAANILQTNELYGNK